MRIFSDVAIDDFSLSPECFGLNIPADDLQGYNYWDPRIGGVKQPHKDFSGKSCKISKLVSRLNFILMLQSFVQISNSTRAVPRVSMALRQQIA